MVSNFLGGGTSVVGEIVSGDAAIEAGVRRRASRADVEGDEGVGRAAAESVEDGGVVESEGDDAAVGADVWRPERCHGIVFDGGAVRAAVVSAIGILVRREGPRRPSMGWVRHFGCFLVAPRERSGGSFFGGKDQTSGTVPWLGGGRAASSEGGGASSGTGGRRSS